MLTDFNRRPARLAAAALAAALSFGLALPALAVDTGGGGGSPSPSGSSGSMSHGSNATAMPAPHLARPAVRLIDLDAARQLIARSDWKGAVKLLRQIVMQQPHNADALNLLGYSLRQEGQMAEAEAWYLKALKLKPTHLGANEYLGELYVMTGQIAKAQARLEALGRICGNTTCSEYQDLAKAIAARA
ncbi:MAG: tetratricopeptide repeat protein [Devosia sp.]|nr:tetratricopeptide repeat protein [Devosia sp.]